MLTAREDGPCSEAFCWEKPRNHGCRALRRLAPACARRAALPLLAAPKPARVAPLYSGANSVLRLRTRTFVQVSQKVQPLGRGSGTSRGASGAPAGPYGGDPGHSQLSFMIGDTPRGSRIEAADARFRNRREENSMPTKPNKKLAGPPDKLLKTSETGKAEIELKEEDLNRVSGGNSFSYTKIKVSY